MKTLSEIGLEPCIGMIIQSPTGKKLRHHIIDLEVFDGCRYILSINENGSCSRRRFADVEKNWFFVGYSKLSFKNLFECERG